MKALFFLACLSLILAYASVETRITAEQTVEALRPLEPVTYFYVINEDSIETLDTPITVVFNHSDVVCADFAIPGTWSDENYHVFTSTTENYQLERNNLSLTLYSMEQGNWMFVRRYLTTRNWESNEGPN